MDDFSEDKKKAVTFQKQPDKIHCITINLGVGNGPPLMQPKPICEDTGRKLSFYYKSRAKTSGYVWEKIP